MPLPSSESEPGQLLMIWCVASELRMTIRRNQGLVRALFSGLVCCFVAGNVCMSRDPADPDGAILSEWTYLVGYPGGSDCMEVLEDFL